MFDFIGTTYDQAMSDPDNHTFTNINEEEDDDDNES
jgi:hypothetical protein